MSGGSCESFRKAGVFSAIAAGWLWCAGAFGQMTVLRYGADRAYPPYEWRDATGAACGFQIDLIRAIGAEMGVAVRVEMGEWGAIREQWLERRLDVVGMSELPSRYGFAEFSDPIAVGWSEIFVRAGDRVPRSLADVTGRTVAVQRGALAEDQLRAMGVQATLVEAESEEGAIELLASGRTECAIVTHTGGHAALRRLGLGDRIRSSPPVLASNIAFAVRQGDTATLGLVNEGLRRLRASGRFNEIHDRWLAETEPPVVVANRVLRYVVWIVTPLLVAIAVVLLWSWSLTRAVRERTQRLAAELEERRRAEAALRASDQRFRSVLKGTKIAVYLQDRDLRYTWTYKLVDGESSRALLGHTDADVVPAAALEALVSAKRRVLETGEGASVVHPATEGADPRWCETVIEPLRDDEGRIEGLICAVVDVTALKRAEAHMIASERRLLQGQRLESLGMLAGGVAHDFGNFLLAIQANAAAAAREVPPDSKAAAMLAAVRSAASRAGELTRQLLAFTGRGDMRPTTVDVGALATELVDLMRPSLSGRVEVRVERGAVPALMADATQIRQVVLNLVRNAADAIGAGPGRVVVAVRTETLSSEEVSAAAVSAESARPGPYVVIEVSDTGPGLDAGAALRAFDPFYTTRAGGSGLGLAVVAGHIKGHGGVVSVRSSPGKGAMFRACIPLRPTGIIEPKRAEHVNS